jgi:hypothetical protein
LQGIKSNKKLIIAFAYAVILFSPAQWIYNSFDSPDPEKLAQKYAGKWILSVKGPGKEIMTNRERLAFYAKGKLVLINESKDIKNNTSVIAVDTSKEGSVDLIKSIENMGLYPLKVITPVFIYFPKK